MVAINAVRIGARIAPGLRWAGSGYFAGEAPTEDNPVDGRYRILNVPARGRVSLHERTTMICIGSVLTHADGTWRIDGVDPTLVCTIIGWDDTRQHNAAIQDWVSAAPL